MKSKLKILSKKKMKRLILIDQNLPLFQLEDIHTARKEDTWYVKAVYLDRVLKHHPDAIITLVVDRAHFWVDEEFVGAIAYVRI